MFSPFIKWVGGKTQLFDDLYKLFPKKIDTYYEPFLGGGAVFLSLLEKLLNGEITIKTFICSDINKELINTYKCVQSNIDDLVELLKILTDIYNNENLLEVEKRHKYIIDLTNVDVLKLKNQPKTVGNHLIGKGKQYCYYFCRDLYNKLINEMVEDDYNSSFIVRASLFIFLNKTCFRGLYRMSKNNFNVPFGNYTNPNIFNNEHLRHLNRMFNEFDVRFINEKYTSNVSKIDIGDFIYLDPPYYPINNKSFVNYTTFGFDEKEHIRLLKLCLILNKKGCKFVQSNSKTEFNMTNYTKYVKFNIKEIECSRRINSKKPDSSEMEIIIFN